MKKGVWIAIAAVALVVVLAIANRKPEFTGKELRDFVGDAALLQRLALSHDVDWIAFRATYEKGPRKLVRRLDDALDIEMDDKIMTAIEAGEGGTIPQVNAQIAALTVIRDFVEYIDLNAKSPDTHGADDRLRWSVEALRPVVEPGLVHYNLTERTKPMWAATAVPGPETFATIARVVRIGLVASWLMELEGVEKTRQSDQGQAIFHTVRSLEFMHMLYNDYSPSYREDAVYIYGELQKRPDAIDLTEIRERMKKIFALSLDLPTEIFAGPGPQPLSNDN